MSQLTQKFIQKQCAGFLGTPPLWINKQFGIVQFKFPEVAHNLVEPQTIPKKIRLGHQIEHRQHKRTIGEIDFILKNKESQRILHIELTYKFYLIRPEISEPIHRLMGPNKRDMFFTKMEKIKHQQFALLHSPEGISALAESEIDHTKIEHQSCFKAQLFKPYKNNLVNIRPLNTSCVCGSWISFEDFNTSEFKKFMFYIPIKSEWVIMPHNDVHWRTHYEISLDINIKLLKENSPMVWMKKSTHEMEKIVVVWW